MNLTPEEATELIIAAGISLFLAASGAAILISAL